MNLDIQTISTIIKLTHALDYSQHIFSQSILFCYHPSEDSKESSLISTKTFSLTSTASHFQDSLICFLSFFEQTTMSNKNKIATLSTCSSLSKFTISDQQSSQLFASVGFKLSKVRTSCQSCSSLKLTTRHFDTTSISDIETYF